MTEFDVMIRNNKGLHARASAKLVELVESFDAKCEISKGDMVVSGDSIMGLLMLAASKGSYIGIKVWGKEYEALANSIHNLIDSHFGEEE